MKQICRLGQAPLFYKAMGLAARLPALTEAEAFALLAQNGNLVKRPFLLLEDGRGTTGFSLTEWENLFSEWGGGDIRVS